MPSVLAVHRAERQKPCAVEIDNDIVCPTCSLELCLEPAIPVSAIDVDHKRGRRVKCSWCGERILDALGAPIEIIENPSD